MENCSHLKKWSKSIITDDELFQIISLNEKSKVPPAHALWCSFCAKQIYRYACICMENVDNAWHWLLLGRLIDTVYPFALFEPACFSMCSILKATSPQTHTHLLIDPQAARLIPILPPEASPSRGHLRGPGSHFVKVSGITWVQPDISGRIFRNEFPSPSSIKRISPALC